MAYDRELEALEIELEIARQQLALIRVLDEGDIKARISELEGVLRFRRLNSLKELARDWDSAETNEESAATFYGSDADGLPRSVKMERRARVIHEHDALEGPPDDVGPHEGKDADADADGSGV